MLHSKSIFWIIVMNVLVIGTESESESTRHKEKRSLIFGGLQRSLLGLFIAIAVPVELPEQNVFVSYNFEANYYLPANLTELGDMTLFAPITTETARMSRSLNRKVTYQILEDNLKREGYPARECLLRSICEASEYPIDHNGVLGGIVHIIFTPSSSQDELLSDDFYKAEKFGKERNCQSYIENCPSSLFDLISKITSK